MNFEKKNTSATINQWGQQASKQHRQSFAGQGQWWWCCHFCLAESNGISRAYKSFKKQQSTGGEQWQKQLSLSSEVSAVTVSCWGDGCKTSATINQLGQQASKQAIQAQLCRARAVAAVLRFLPDSKWLHQQEIKIIQEATINHWWTATAIAVTVQWCTSNCATGGYHAVMDEFQIKYFGQ